MDEDEKFMNELAKEVEALKLRVERLENISDHHDKILIRGYDEYLPLTEIVRSLAKTVNDYITRKEKEEEKVFAQREKWKWTIIPIIVGILATYIIQVYLFVLKIYPILENLNHK